MKQAVYKSVVRYFSTSNVCNNSIAGRRSNSTLISQSQDCIKQRKLIAKQDSTTVELPMGSECSSSSHSQSSLIPFVSSSNSALTSQRRSRSRNTSAAPSRPAHGTNTLSKEGLREFLLKPSALDIAPPKKLNLSLPRRPAISSNDLLAAYSDGHWLVRIFGSNEEQLEESYSQCEELRASPPPSATINTIEQLFNDLRREPAVSSSSSSSERWPHVRLVMGLDSLLLPSARAANRGFIQVRTAS